MFEVPDWVLLALLPLAAVVGAYLSRSFYGLNPIQVAAKSESDRLIDLQEKRIELLEKEVIQVRNDYNFLLSENRSLRLELADLRQLQTRRDMPTALVPVQVEVQPIIE